MSFTSTAASLPFPSLVILFLPSLSLSLSSCFSTPLRRYVSSEFFFFLVCVCYFAWCLVFGWWENVGKQREIYIFLFWYDLWIYTWFWVFFLVIGIWLLRKCGKAKGNRLFFFPLICLVSKKLEEIKSRLNWINWNPISLVSVPNLVKSKILVQWKNRTSNRLNCNDYTPTSNYSVDYMIIFWEKNMINNACSNFCWKFYLFSIFIFYLIVFSYDSLSILFLILMFNHSLVSMLLERGK